MLPRRQARARGCRRHQHGFTGGTGAQQACICGTWCALLLLLSAAAEVAQLASRSTRAGRGTDALPLLLAHAAYRLLLALSNLQEELGLDPACVQVIACLPPFLSKHLLSVTPVIATIPPHQQFSPNPQEVSCVCSGQAVKLPILPAWAYCASSQ